MDYLYIFIVVGLLMSGGIIYILDKKQTNLKINKINELRIKYSRVGNSPVWNGYFNFVDIHLIDAINFDYKHNQSFSAFNMCFNDLERILTIVDSENYHGEITKDLTPILDEITTAYSKYEEYENNNFKKELYGQMEKLFMKIEIAVNNFERSYI